MTNKEHIEILRVLTEDNPLRLADGQHSAIAAAICALEAQDTERAIAGRLEAELAAISANLRETMARHDSLVTAVVKAAATTTDLATLELLRVALLRLDEVS